MRRIKRETATKNSRVNNNDSVLWQYIVITIHKNDFPISVALNLSQHQKCLNSFLNLKIKDNRSFKMCSMLMNGKCDRM